MTEEYRILSTVLEAKYVKKNAKSIVLRSRFTSFKPEDLMEKYLCKNLKKLDKTAMNDLINKSQQDVRIQEHFDLTLPYVILEDTEATSIFSSKSGWDLFYEKYDGSTGLIEVSRVGFNSDHSQALICIGEQKHWRRGYGSYYLLSGQNDSWSLVDSTRAWIS